MSPTTPLTMITIDTPRGTFGARALGDPRAPLVLCLHGFPDDASTFDDLLVRLAGVGFRAVAPYLRGFAPSPLDSPWGVGALADDLRAIADALAPIVPVSVVAHDLGALAAWRALEVAPSRFARAVILSTPHPRTYALNARRSPMQLARGAVRAALGVPGLPAWLLARRDFALVERMWRWCSPGFLVPEDHVARVKATLARSWPCPLRHLRADGGGAKPAGGAIATPVLYLHGERDRCVAPEMAASQENELVGVLEARLIGSAGRALQLERPVAVAAEVLRWLADELRIPSDRRVPDEVTAPRLA